MEGEPGWLGVLVRLVAGFLLLGAGAHWLVEGSSQLARRAGVSILLVGLTVVAFGTSAPEIVVSAMASWQGQADISLGNVLGSNVANVGLVLGACALILPGVLEKPLALRELFWLFASLGVFWWTASDRAVTRVEGVLLLAVFLAFNVHLLLTARRGAELPIEKVPERAVRRPVPVAILGIVAILFGARLTVVGAETGALKLGIPPSVVGLTVVAVGTSLPELAAGVGGAIKGESDISLGNVVGSNVFNLLAVIGITACVRPLDPAHFRPERAGELEAAFENALHEDLWVVLAFSLAAWLLPLLGGRQAGRAKGALLLATWGAYVVWLYAAR